jgi:hypothetical protein
MDSDLFLRYRLLSSATINLNSPLNIIACALAWMINIQSDLLNLPCNVNSHFEVLRALMSQSLLFLDGSSIEATAFRAWLAQL